MNKRQKDCLWKQRTHYGLENGSLGFIETKHAYSNILKNSSPKTEISDKNSEIFHISAQNIDCGYSSEPPHQGGSNEYQQSMFLSRNKKNNVYPF